MASIRDLATAASAAAVKVGGFDHVPPAGPGTPRGSLIVLEGLDRSGKTTQVKLLEQRFVELGKKVRLMRFPGKSSFTHTHTLSSLLGSVGKSGRER